MAQSEGYILYLRRSTTDEDMQQYSLEAQEDACKKYADREGLTIYETIREKHSAKHAGKRPLFMQMVKELEKGKYKGVICHKVNRLLRSNGDFVKIEWLLDNTAVEFHFLDGMFPNNSHGRFMFAMMVAQSKWYVDNLSEEVKKGMYISRKKGLFPHQPPPGYTEIWKVQTGMNPNDGKGRKVFHPTSAPIIKEGMVLYACRKIPSILKLSQWYYDQGIMGGDGKALSTNGLQKMLRNPFYYGVVKHGDEEFPGVHPPLISKDLFLTIQDVMDNKSPLQIPKGSKPFPYRGLLSCFCGRTLSGFVQKGFVYYGCHRPGCGGTIKEEKIEEELGKIFEKILVNLRPLEMVESSMKQLKKLSFEEKARHLADFVERERGFEEELVKCRAMAIAGTFSKEDFDAEKKRIEKERVALGQEKVNFDMLDPNAFEEFFIRLKLLRSSLESYKTLDPLQKHQIVDLAFFKLIFKDKILASYNLRESFDVLAKPLPVLFGGAEGMGLNSIMSFINTFSINLSS